MKPKYEILAGEIAKRGMKKSAIAARMQVGSRSLNNKIYGLTPFTWEEVNIIKDNFFPEMDLQTLFKVSETN